MLHTHPASKNQLPGLLISIDRKWVNFCNFRKYAMHHSNSILYQNFEWFHILSGFDKVPGDCSNFLKPELLKVCNEKKHNFI